jgi:hypothetical protein
MNDFFIRRKLRRFHAAGNSEEVEDDIVKEFRLLIRLDGKDFIQAMLTPSQVVEFVVRFITLILRNAGLRFQGVFLRIWCSSPFFWVFPSSPLFPLPLRTGLKWVNALDSPWSGL